MRMMCMCDANRWWQYEVDSNVHGHQMRLMRLGRSLIAGCNNGRALLALRLKDEGVVRVGCHQSMQDPPAQPGRQVVLGGLVRMPTSAPQLYMSSILTCTSTTCCTLRCNRCSSSCFVEQDTLELPCWVALERMLAAARALRVQTSTIP